MSFAGTSLDSGRCAYLPLSRVSMKLKREGIGLTDPRSQNQDTLQKENTANYLDGFKRRNISFVNICVQKLWKCKDAEEFNQFFVDCLECHYGAYNTMGHILDLDISENSVMVYRPPEGNDLEGDPNSDLFNFQKENDRKRARGVLIDFDLSCTTCTAQVSSKPASEGNFEIGLHNLQHHRNIRPGTQIYFMAHHLIRTEAGKLPPQHFYRYDLESFFYLLIWATVHYDFDRPRRLRHKSPHISSRRSTPSGSDLEKWGVHTNAFYVKKNLRLGRVVEYVVLGWEDVWERWVIPLTLMFGKAHLAIHHARTSHQTGYDHATCGGLITFDTFMKIIGVTPCRPRTN